MGLKKTRKGVSLRPVTVEVIWPGRLDLPMCLESFRRWGDDGIDYWDGDIWVRTVRLGEQVIPFACKVTGTIQEPKAEVTVMDSTHTAAVKQAVQDMIITVSEPFSKLLASDPVIADLEAQFEGIRPVLQGDLFTNLIRSISAQQVNLRWAATTRRRLAEAYGDMHSIAGHAVYSLNPQRLAEADPANLRKLQFTTRKAEYIINLARCVVQGTVDLEHLRKQSDEEVIGQLTQLRGIGRWTAEWFLARGLGRPCVVGGDLGVRKAVGGVYLQGEMPSEAEVRRLTQHWGAAASVAQQLVLHTLNQRV
ncbi:MAG: hypothetical protein O7G88_00425 [bacterium]|nr:hypothetical protein [bacterium]